ncbi:hypothetical protein ABRY23_02200 [Melioribacteraceae bacterium 4301-Me]|uniref:hypothetical protein n=1 Tax=Pyranulibacter aquaticus TaxID=3163344 RepID=UPI00359AAEA1
MKMISKIFLVIILLIGNFTIAQQKFHVEFNQLKGELTLKDNYRKDFGRYHGYEIPLYKGDGVVFIAYSESFKPSLVLVTPNGNVFKQSKNNKSDFVQINAKIPESGNWILYVVGDSSALGSYELQYGFADKNSLSPGENPDFCTALDFVLEHANAYFLLLDNPIDSQKPFIKFPQALDIFLDDSDGSFTITFYQGDDYKQALNFYKKYFEMVKNCLKENFSFVTNKSEQSEEYKNTYSLFTEKLQQKPRAVKVDLYDFSVSKTKQPVNYLVDISVGKLN